MTEALTETLTELALFELLSLECRVGTDGTVHYFNALGQRHRVYGPAVEYSNGACAWHQNGRLHRLDGPAIERPDGYRAWYQDGLRHRLGGPAVEWPDGTHRWFIDGKEHTQAQWRRVVASMETV